MDRKAFLAWLSEVDTLSEAQKVEVGEVLAGRPAGEASVAAVELGVGEDRTCPHCGAHGAVANGKSRGMQRYLCRWLYSYIVLMLIPARALPRQRPRWNEHQYDVRIEP